MWLTATTVSPWCMVPIIAAGLSGPITCWTHQVSGSICNPIGPASNVTVYVVEDGVAAPVGAGVPVFVLPVLSDEWNGSAPMSSSFSSGIVVVRTA